MTKSELQRSRKALAALLGFLLRGSATLNLSATLQPAPKLELIRDGKTARAVDARIFKLAIERGLIVIEPGRAQSSQAVRTCMVTPEGRAALRRWLSDPESAFQDQHRTLVPVSDPEQGRFALNQEESPLAALARIKGRGGVLFLEPALVEAGERLRADFTRGQMQPSLGQNWEPVRTGRQYGIAGGAVELSDSAMAARLRVQAAMADVGPELSGVLLDVCCFLKRLTEVERERQWPARSAKLMLRTALAALARHYAMPGPGVSRRPAPPPHVP